MKECDYCKRPKDSLIEMEDWNEVDGTRIKVRFCDQFCAWSYAFEEKRKLIEESDKRFYQINKKFAKQKEKEGGK